MAGSFRTQAFEAYVAAARPRAAIWRIFLGSATILGVYVGLLLLVLGGFYLFVGPLPTAMFLGRMLHPVVPFPTLMLISTHLAMAFGAFAAVRLVDRRRFGTLFGRAPRVLRDFAIACGCFWLVFALASIPWALRFDALPNLDLRTWLRFLPFALVAILVQTLAEELVFRAYLMQGLAARFRSALIWFLLPALLFGLAHYSVQMNGSNAWGVVAAAGLVGLLAADLTRVTGSIGAAWGLHFANNCIALLLIATDGTITGLALWHTSYASGAPQMAAALAIDFVTLLAAWGLTRRLAAR